jgi:hypothetical protein
VKYRKSPLVEDARAEMEAHQRIWRMPLCRVCRRPMTCGQVDTHYSCADTKPSTP